MTFKQTVSSSPGNQPKKAPRRRLRPVRTVVLSFAIIIVVGTLLLLLPFATRSGGSAGPVTALFTATSATCVTGLVLVDTWLTWSLFGQVVILVLIQLGGLGFVSAMAIILLALHRKITLSQRLLIVTNFNLKDMDGVSRLVQNAWKGTLIMEGAGAVLLSCCFVPEYGWKGGIWRGIFHSVSAFCNAGFDLMAGKGSSGSMSAYEGNPVVLLILMILIVVGGLGFFVWEDIRRNRRWRKLSPYTKLMLTGTAILILLGWIAVLAGEWTNPDTLGTMPIWKKLLNGLFQSVTLRTAGFNVLNQGDLHPATQVVSILLMLIGGGSGSTAGGIKVGTLGVLILALRSGLTGRDQVTLCHRRVPYHRVFDALTLLFTAGFLFLLGTMALTIADSIPLQAAAFETASAIGTVGLSMGITAGLSLPSHIILICLMFLGRVGILSFSMAFLTRRTPTQNIKYPPTNMMVG